MPKRITSLMTSGYITMDEDSTVKEALKEWKKLTNPSKVSHIIYILDNSKKLVGIVDLREIFLQAPSKKLKKLMKKRCYFVNEKSTLVNAVSVVVEHKISEVPVVDKDKKLLGVVLSEDILNNLKWDKNHNINRVVNIIKSDEKIEINFKHIFKIIKERVGWLIVCVFAGVFLAGGVIKNYEAAIVTVPALAVFIPVLMATGGNIGAQTSTIFARTFSMDEPKYKERVIRLLFLDMITGLILGIVLGATIAGSSYIMFPGDLYLAFVLFVSTVLISIVAVFLGFAIPFLSSLIDIDPAITSGPLVTTIKDVLALLIYFFVVYLFYL